VRNVAETDDEIVLRRVMQRQSSLSLKVAVLFVLILVGLPLLNQFHPEIMLYKIGGFTVSWLLLGVAFYPITWAMSFLFVQRSNAIEAELADEAAR
jgi:uncharacterized membrane protein (DUF485 family)